MKNVTQRIVGAIIGILLIAGGFGGALYFVKTKPKPARRPISSMIPVVETMPLPVTNQSLIVECLGTVLADKTAAVQPEVSGRIIYANPQLVEGGMLHQDEVLVEVEPADYQLALQSADANLQMAMSKLRIEEGQQETARYEHKLMNVQETNAYTDLVLREPQLKSAKASVKSAEIAVKVANLNLDRTKIRTPFDAVVVSTDADVGDYAQKGKELFELAAIDRYFVRTSIPLKTLESLPNIGKKPYRALLTLSDGTTRNAYTFKLLPDLTKKGRMARLLLAVDSPFASSEARPLLIGEMVRVRIKGSIVKGVSQIPRRYLQDGNKVWMIDKKDKLKILSAKLLQGYADTVLVKVDTDPGDKLITTDLSAAVDGMQLRRVGDSSSRGKFTDAKEKKPGDKPGRKRSEGKPMPAGEGN